MSLTGDVLMALRLARALPRHFRRTMRSTASGEEVRARLDRRDETFLAFVRRAVFAHPESPYARLLAHAGCTLADLADAIHRDGLEPTLVRLFGAGVHLGVDEFKGRRDVVRGSLRFRTSPDDMRNPLVLPQLHASTSGSRGPATSVRLDLDSVRDRVVNLRQALIARGGQRWVHAVWGVRGLTPLLWYSGLGRPAAGWFVMSGASGGGSRFRWSARFVTGWSRLLGIRLPAPVEAPFEDPRPVLDWMTEVRAQGGVPHLWSSVSAAVQLARRAKQEATDLTGVQFTVTGESVTPARLRAIRSVGAEAAPDYGSADAGGFFTGACANPEAADDLHLFHDLVALIQPSATVGSGPLFVTSLRPTAPFVLLNVSMGDQAVLAPRSCGCPLERDGWTTHLREIRSFEKLTAAGMTFDDGEVVTVLENELPSRFGGGPLDYQLAEVEEPDGSTVVHLRVAPSVGEVDPAAVATDFLEAIGTSSATQRDMADQWRRAGVLRVVREAPVRGRTGKVLHVTSDRRPTRRPGPA